MNIQDLTPQDKRKLEKLAKIIDEGDLAILDHLFEIEESITDALDKVDGKVKELEDTVKPNLNSILEQVKGKDGIVGPQGEQGIQGEKGEQGNDGKNGKDGKDGRDGRDGRDGTDGLNGEAGRDGIDGKDGLSGSPDSPNEIADKINTLYQKIKPETIIGWNDLQNRLKVPDNFDVRIGVSKTEIKRLTDRVVVLESNPSGGGFSTLEPTETPDSTTTVFTFSTTTQPSFIVSDNAMMRATTKSGVVNWSWSGNQATMSLPPNEDLIAIV